jgi:AraC-like DNA-binding protein
MPLENHHKYREHRPAPDLRDLVDCFWSRTLGNGMGEPHRVLPDGCVDLLFDLDAGRGFVVGTMTRALMVPGDTLTRVVAVRFRPGAASALLRRPIHELTDRQIPLADVWRDARAVEARVQGGVAALEQILRERLRDVDPVPLLVRGAVERIAASPVATSVRALSAELGVTRQHLTRVFDQHVGVGPKMLARVLRMRRVVSRLSAGDEHLAGLAADAGYCDQAHMTSELRALTGLTPGGWQRSISPRRAVARAR